MCYTIQNGGTSCLLKIIPTASEKYGVNAKVLSRWIQRYNEYGEEGLKTNWKTKVRDQRIKELERENAELREEAEILKKAAAFLADAIRK